ncbi:uncharacterized protein C1orf105 homolog isoform X3 [Eptesicus fuscus]|uniref:uncharacterized protein C1orf105 homolog isoform X3 n=1 Tax=Eptesicus fuscus TaxID=29078 RepID=UPI002403B52E|nr:uncharacterized protein C1orf105 homolog isoform X3 [Eptesicus fuscus]
MEKRELKASVPKFEKIPWLCEASLRNKPLVLSLPRRYPHASATSLNSWRKDVNLPNTFQVPNGLSKARRNHRGPVLGRSRQLCSTCQEVKMVQPRTMMIPDELKHSFENCLSHRLKNLQPPKARTEPRCSPDDISTVQVGQSLESVMPVEVLAEKLVCPLLRVWKRGVKEDSAT